MKMISLKIAIALIAVTAAGIVGARAQCGQIQSYPCGGKNWACPGDKTSACYNVPEPDCSPVCIAE